MVPVPVRGLIVFDTNGVKEVDSEVRGTTLQKLIVDSEVREYDSTKVNRR